jgi:hypothetical protein
VWRVGDGSQIKVWEDNWIPRTGAKHPLGCLREDRPSLVSCLVAPGGGTWDEDEVRKYFVPSDVEDILRTPLGRSGQDDFLAWNHTKTGVFSVRSAYLLAVQRKKQARGRGESSRSCDEHKGGLLYGTPRSRVR